MLLNRKCRLALPGKIFHLAAKNMRYALERPEQKGFDFFSGDKGSVPFNSVGRAAYKKPSSEACQKAITGSSYSA